MGLETPNGFNLDNSGKRVVVDPVTRIEGHLRVEVNVDYNNVIRNAVSTGTMWRGIEVILQGPRPARRLGLHRADMRRLHRHPRADLGARRGRRARRSRSRKTPIRSATSCNSRCRCTTTSCISTTCMRSTGSMWSRLCRPIRKRPRLWRSRSRLAVVLARLFQRPAGPSEAFSSSPANSGRSRTAIGAARPITCRPRPI